ncbi:hypothetical protein GCM10009718_16630 [Isoptericola halotolerans]
MGRNRTAGSCVARTGPSLDRGPRALDPGRDPEIGKLIDDWAKALVNGLNADEGVASQGRDSGVPPNLAAAGLVDVLAGQAGERQALLPVS